jgi:hypothetical protein
LPALGNHPAVLLSTLVMAIFPADTPSLPPCLPRADLPALGNHPAVLLSTLVMVIFLADIVVSFFVGYFDENGALIMDLRRVANNYAL